MSTIVGYLYRGVRYTPLGMKEFLIRTGKIDRAVFEPTVDRGAFYVPLPEPSIATVIDAHAETPALGVMVFMDQPETYSDNDWPKYIFDDEVSDEETMHYIGAPDVRDWFDGRVASVDNKIMRQNDGRIPSRIRAKVYYAPTEWDGGNSWHYVVEAFPLHDSAAGRSHDAGTIDYGNVESKARAWECITKALANRQDYDGQAFVQVRADRRPKP
jgi:hypothetical protein